MDRPFAITLDVGSSLANKTGAWRTERPVYVDLLPPCNDACPAGENIQRWLYHAEERRLRSGVAADHGGQPVPGRSWAGSATTPARPRATGPARRGRGHQLGRAVPRRRGPAAGLDGAGDAPPVGQAGARRRRRPGRTRRPPITCALLGHDVTVRDAGPRPAA